MIQSNLPLAEVVYSSILAIIWMGVHLVLEVAKS